MCLDVIFTVSEHKRALLTKNPTLLKQVIDTVFTMVVENKKNQGIIFILRWNKWLKSLVFCAASNRYSVLKPPKKQDI